MKELQEVPNRKPPFIWGRTLVLFAYNNEATISIGPEVAYWFIMEAITMIG